MALASFFAAIALAIAERYVASIIALLSGIAVLSYLSEQGTRHEG